MDNIYNTLCIIVFVMEFALHIFDINAKFTDLLSTCVVVNTGHIYWSSGSELSFPVYDKYKKITTIRTLSQDVCECFLSLALIYCLTYDFYNLYVIYWKNKANFIIIIIV